MRILIADDDQDIRLLLSKILEKWGHEVVLAADGAEAWDILQKEDHYFVITDWMMPRMDGLALCKKIRDTGFSHYVYIIMLTARDSNNELVEGMKAGADDFIIKPFKKDELNVRIKAGERVIKLEKDLAEQNRHLSKAYSVIRKDLEAAGKIQASLLPKSAANILNIQFDWMFLPSAFVAGDIFNYFRLDETHVGFYLLDVAGHGIPAALLSVTLSKVLSPLDINNSPLKHFVPDPPHYEITSPAMVVKDLNSRFQADDDIMQYFTMVYGVINVKNGQTTITQAGHPNPILVKKEGETTMVGSGGFPVGMLPDIDYDEFEVSLNKGDRLILYSDGIIECMNSENKQFSVERFIDLLNRYSNLPEHELIQKTEQALLQWKGNNDFEDDVTLLAIEVKSG